MYIKSIQICIININIKVAMSVRSSGIGPLKNIVSVKKYSSLFLGISASLK